MIIRIMDIEDYEKVYDLWIHTAGMGLNEADDSREGIVKYLTRNPNTCFVAEDNGTIAGVIMSGDDGRRGFLYHTAVKEEYRGQGTLIRFSEIKNEYDDKIPAPVMVWGFMLRGGLK